MWGQGFTDGVIGRDWPHLLVDLTGLGFIPTTPEDLALYLESWRAPGILSTKRWLGKSRIQNLVIGKLIRFKKKKKKNFWDQIKYLSILCRAVGRISSNSSVQKMALKDKPHFHPSMSGYWQDGAVDRPAGTRSRWHLYYLLGDSYPTVLSIGVHS